MSLGGAVDFTLKDKVRDGKLRFVVEKGIGGIVEFEEGVFATPVEEAVARDIIMKMK